MAITTAPQVLDQWAVVLNRNLTEYYRNAFGRAPEEYTKLVKVESTTRYVDEYDGAQGIARPVPNRDLEPVPQRSPVKMNRSIIRQVNFRSGLTIEDTLLRFGEHSQVWDNTEDLMESYKSLMDAYAADLYNDGFSAQSYDFVEADGTQRAFFSTSHRREDNGASFSNYLNVAVPPNLATLFDVIATMERYTDAVGNFISMDKRYTMLIPNLQPDWMKAAAEIVHSVDNPETSDRSINAAKKLWNLDAVSISNFTSNSKWFVRCDTEKRYFPLIMRVGEQPNMTPFEKISGNPHALVSVSRAIFGVGVRISARGVFAIGA